MKRLTGFEKGVNLGGWFSHENYEKEHFDNFISESDIEKIAGWGCDHVRLTVDYNIFEDDNGAPDESGYEYVENAIAMCRKHGLNTVLDLHKAAGFSYEVAYSESGLFESEKLQEKFYKLWESFAERFGKYSDTVAFELLNEVTEPSYIDTWNKMWLTCSERIRKYAPDTVIIIGSYWNNSVDAVKDLAIPFDDNFAYNFHCYDPFIFTHQGAYWVQTMPADFRISYPGDIFEYRRCIKELGLEYMQTYDNVPDSGFDADYFMGRFSSAVKVCEDRNIPLYCGEYGADSWADSDSVLQWYKDINKAFNRLGIARCAWSYKEMDFGISDSDRESVQAELVKHL